MYAATGGPNMKWGHRFEMGGRAPLPLSLETTLVGASAYSPACFSNFHELWPLLGLAGAYLIYRDTCVMQYPGKPT